MDVGRDGLVEILQEWSSLRPNFWRSLFQSMPFQTLTVVLYSEEIIITIKQTL